MEIKNTLIDHPCFSQYVRILSLMALFVCNGPLQADQTIILVGDPWPPYVNGELGQDASSGIAVEIAQKIFSGIDGADVRFPLIPWNRALREVESGISDGIGLLLKTTERDRYMRFSIPLLEGKSMIWSVTAGSSNSFEWTEIEDLAGHRVGIIQGYSYGEEVDRSIEKGEIKVVKTPTVEQLFAMLANGRVDLALANDAVGYSLSRQFPKAAIRPSKKMINSETFYMGISRKSSAVALIPEINQQIELMQTNGDIERIIRGE